jgi:hypothetical protein
MILTPHHTNTTAVIQNGSILVNQQRNSTVKSDKLDWRRRRRRRRELLPLRETLRESMRKIHQHSIAAFHVSPLVGTATQESNVWVLTVKGRKKEK